jgi:UDP-2,3-diacylglucosamine pyrophosphatase LpxH
MPLLQYLLPAPAAVGCFRHPAMRSDVYHEAKAVLALGLDDPAVVQAQMQAYAATNYSSTVPICDTSFLLRRTHDVRVLRHACLWQAHVARWSRRDQLSFDFTLTKTNLTAATAVWSRADARRLIREHLHRPAASSNRHFKS